MVHNSDEVRYAYLKIYVYNSYVNGKDCFPKTLSAMLNVIVKCKGDNRPPVLHYESREGIALTTKGNIGEFRGD